MRLCWIGWPALIDQLVKLSMMNICKDWQLLGRVVSQMYFGMLSMRDSEVVSSINVSCMRRSR